MTPRRKWRSLFSPELVPRQQRQQQQSGSGSIFVVLNTFHSTGLLTNSSSSSDEGATTSHASSPDSPPLQQATRRPTAATAAPRPSLVVGVPPTAAAAETDAAAELARYWPRPPPAMTAWRERQAARTASVVKLADLMSAMHKRKCSLSKHRAAAVTLFVLLMVSCPDMADVQVVALAVQYLDRYIVASSSPASSSPPIYKNYFHAAAACMALALKWERQDAGHDLASAPAAFNRLLELFQGFSAPPLTLATLGRLEQDVCVCLEFDMWTCTPAEWLCLVRDAGPVAACTDGDATTYPPLCWLRREPCAPGADPLPRLEETAAALARLPLEEQLLLHALRRPELVGWSPVRLGAACLVAAGRCGPARCEAARLCTSSALDTTIMLETAVRSHRATSKDAAALASLLQRQQTATISGVLARLPPPPPPIPPRSSS